MTTNPVLPTTFAGNFDSLLSGLDHDDAWIAERATFSAAVDSDPTEEPAGRAVQFIAPTASSEEKAAAVSGASTIEFADVGSSDTIADTGLSVAMSMDTAAYDVGGEGSGESAGGGEAAAAAAAGGADMPLSAGPPVPPQHNGSADTTAVVAATGDQRIDGVLSGVRWADGFITYSDPNSAADYQAAYNYDDDGDGVSVENEGFSQLSNAQRVAAHFALNQAIYTQPVGAGGFSVEGFTNLGIDYAGTGVGTGTIRLANSTDPGTAYAFYPNNSIYGGDAWFGPSGDAPTAGNYDWHTVIHELGHSLGLKHGHEAGGVAGALPSDVDSLEYSVMTYRTYIGDNTSGYNYETWGAPQTFMMMDIAALQHMYGADYTSNSGNTVYTWNPTTGESYVNGALAIDPGGNRIFETIWDGGGIDTYDASNYTVNQDIDLRPGEYSVLSTAQRANLGGGPNGGFARGNVFNALLFGGNTASLIENANGGSGGDILQGNQAANVLNGNAGNDSLLGDSGNDTLNGGDGNDTIDGGSGVDVMNGGSGNDLFRIVNGWTGGAGEQANGGAGVDTFDVSATSISTSTINLVAGTFTYSPGGSGTIALTNIENVVSGASADTVIGSSAANLVTAGAGNDSLTGGDGNDTLNGGDGNDTIDGGSGVDVMNGDGGDDLFRLFNGWTGGAGEQVNGGTGVDTFDVSAIGVTTTAIDLVAGTFNYSPGGSGTIALTGIENVISGGSADTITGSSAANLVTAGAGNDSLLGGAGNDTLNGGDGNDTIDGGSGVDVMNGDAGDDLIRIVNGWTGGAGEQANGGVGVDTFDTSAITVTTSNINLTAGTFTYSPGGSGTIALSGIENVTSGASADTIIGSTANNRLVSGAGNDFVEAGIGNDTVEGGIGNDTLQGGFGTDTVLAGDGDDLIQVLNGQFIDVVDGGIGIDTLDMSAETATASSVNLAAGSHTGMGGTFATTNVENFFGSQLADTITGSALANRLEGRGGNDTILGGVGNDTIDGGTGNDRIDGQAGLDSMIGGAGNDTLFVDNAGDVVNELNGGGTDVAITTAAAWTLTAGAYVETVSLGGVANISATGNELNNNMIGNAGNNVLNGALGNDVLQGGNGNDTLNGGDNNDTLTGQVGFDSLNGGAGNDVLNVEDIGDVVAEAAGGGVDTVRSTAASYTLTAGAEIENFQLLGAAVSGTGNAFANNIVGNAGNNVLEGGLGADVLTGGAGGDLFVFSALGDSPFAAPDRITDFVQGVDLIDLDTIDAIPATGANDDFSFIGAGAFTGVAGQLRYVAAATTQVLGDVNGDSVADFRILLTGAFALNAADFDL